MTTPSGTVARKGLKEEVPTQPTVVPDMLTQTAGNGRNGDAVAAPQAPVPPGGSRVVVDRDGGRTTITSAALPPELMPMARMAQETALGLMGLLAAIFIPGPFARMIARRMERRPEIDAQSEHSKALQQQLAELQHSIDAMSVEVERISEAQRFHSKLLYDKRAEGSIPM